MAAGGSHEADGAREATGHPVLASSTVTGPQRQHPAFGYPDNSPWARAEREADREAAAILGNSPPRLRARSAGASVPARRGDPMDRGRSLRIRLFTAVAGLVFVLGVAIGVGSAAPGRAIPSPRPQASLAALASTPPVAAATVAPSASSKPSPRPTAPAPTPRPTPAIPAARIRYKVQPGDTLIRIAARYNVTVAQIVQANRIPDPHFIYSGQVLVIPPPIQASP